MTYRIAYSDKSGREGRLILNDKEIVTPKYIPTAKEFDCLDKCKLIGETKKHELNVGTYTKWIGQGDIKSLSDNDKPYYEKIKKEIIDDTSSIDGKQKLLHFEFYKDVDNLSIEALKQLMNLQSEIGASVLEVPNSFFFKQDYNAILKDAFKWRQDKKPHIPFMGIAFRAAEVESLKSKISDTEDDTVQCIGVDLSRKDDTIFPLLFSVGRAFKNLDLWIHAFSLQRTFEIGHEMASVGILINKVGVDTISPYMGYQTGGGGDSGDNKYFIPREYNVTTINSLRQMLNDKKADDIKLSEFCQCPICRNSRLSDISKGAVYDKIRSHEVLAHSMESKAFKDEIRKNKSDDYITKKKYASQILSEIFKRPPLPT